MSNSDNTQLTPTLGYDTSRMIFSAPIAGNIPDSKPKIEFKRINILTKNEDGTVGELVLPTTRLFSFGVSENTSQETGKVNGYTFPLCLWNKDGPTDEEQTWTDTFSEIVSKCIEHLIDVKDDIDMYDLTEADLKKAKGGLDPLYWKKEKHTNAQGKTVLRVVPGTGPTLYTKLIFSKKSNKFLSMFFDTNNEPLNALDLMGKYCFTNAAVKIESIFIGSKISLQVKLYEAVIEPTNTGMKPLISRPRAQSKVLEHKANAGASSKPMLDFTQEGEGEDDDNNSLVDDDDDDNEDDTPAPTPVEPEKPKAKRTVRRVTAKK